MDDAVNDLVEWVQMRSERDERGELTSLAQALNAIDDHSCKCRRCLHRACLAQEALRDLWREREKLRREIAEMKGSTP